MESHWQYASWKTWSKRKKKTKERGGKKKRKDM
jgi:hypothetical protein